MLFHTQVGGPRTSKKHYSAHKLECLCLKWNVVDKFHYYLYGDQFEVRTDNNPLSYVTKTAKLNATSHCWLVALSAYDFKIKSPGVSERMQRQNQTTQKFGGT